MSRRGAGGGARGGKEGSRREGGEEGSRRGVGGKEGREVSNLKVLCVSHTCHCAQLVTVNPKHEAVEKRDAQGVDKHHGKSVVPYASVLLTVAVNREVRTHHLKSPMQG